MKWVGVHRNAVVDIWMCHFGQCTRDCWAGCGLNATNVGKCVDMLVLEAVEQLLSRMGTAATILGRRALKSE